MEIIFIIAKCHEKLKQLKILTRFALMFLGYTIVTRDNLHDYMLITRAWDLFIF